MTVLITKDFRDPGGARGGGVTQGNMVTFGSGVFLLLKKQDLVFKKFFLKNKIFEGHGMKGFFGGFSLKEDPGKMNSEGMNCIFLHICTKITDLSAKKQHTQ